tara:strand:+ start:24281 stop:26542 length:2262 start_codon:yes stop_codon:yes gene_type:complete
MYEITYFKGSHTNTKDGQVWGFESFDELADEFSRCAKGAKFSAYIVRGKLAKGERKDSNLKSSKLLIIDGDEGLRGKPLCKPEEVHSALVEMGINHFIYTTHSHSTEQNKFRVVIASEQYEKDDTKGNNKLVLKELALRGCKIKHVKEMNTWSQPWFVPTRDNPDDGLFEAYKFTDGKEWKVIKDEQENESKSEEAETESSTDGNTETLDQMHENIRSGKEYHESLRTLSYQYVKDGMSGANTKAVLKSLLNGSKDAGSERWMVRFKDVDRLVEGALARVEGESAEFEMPDVESDVFQSDLPKPPGLLGELYDCCYDTLLYQYHEVALVSSIGLIAGICGRKFNVMEPAPSGLNLFLTIVAGTGFGKESIATFINKCVRGSSKGLKEHRSFIGPSNFTGPKAIVNSFTDARSRVCVISEAGLMMKVKSGNVEGKTAFILDAFSTSHSEGYTKESSYSSKDDYVAEIRAMAMTIISESTEEQLMDAYKGSGALASGYLPRQLIFKIHQRSDKVNRKAQYKLSDKLSAKLSELMELSASVQCEDDPSAVSLFFEDDAREDMLNYIDTYAGIAREFERTDVVKSVMATRIAQKAVRLAGICSVFNSKKIGSDITMIEWEWAKSLCDYEFGNVTSALAGLAGNDDMDNAVLAVYNKIAGILDDSIRNKKCRIDYRYRKRKVITYGILKIATDKNTNVRSMGDNNNSGNYRTGLDKVLDYMEKQGVIKSLNVDPLGGKSTKLIQVNEGIVEFIYGYQG